MRRALAFDNSPVLSVPLRFFLTAPAFALLASILLFLAGPQAFASRWTSYTLALTHLFTLGVLANAMAGALMQILPVATGISVLAPRLTSAIVHAMLTFGTLLLAAAFLLAAPPLFKLASCALLLAFVWLLAACAGGFWRHRNTAAKGAEDVLLAGRLALVSLFVAVVLGATLAAGFAWPGLRLSMVLLTNIHAGWGLLGWVGLLLAGMAYQVIPIFQITELYPRPITRWMAPLIFILLGAWTASMLLQFSFEHAARHLLTALILAAYALFAGTTLHLLYTRKRPTPDATTLFWRTAMFSLAGCALLWPLQLATQADYSITLGMLFIVGFAWSAINGMLYKILPFLLWYHAQNKLVMALRVVPKVKDIIPDHIATRQFRAHACALPLLIGATVWPGPLTHVAAVAMAVSVSWLVWNMAYAIRLFLNAKKQIAASLEQHAARQTQSVEKLASMSPAPGSPAAGSQAAGSSAAGSPAAGSPAAGRPDAR